ncbi:alpha/beta fold hydrolase [Microbacterium sp. cf332]|uniref:alpha/beta fold hydrolase n=1 Tax=Microbacterium sp. cf332 TaxID=1761804 RepID=UPI0008860996|nr:alpha/beta hydrolase [Microbacterium sp. cf332]SDQ59215.1 Pimeloyl-ACP methyl ester carboxylesterase [Microbacterium sp. cf332]
MVPLVLLPGMNCTADLWAGTGLDDAVAPELGEDSLDAQVDVLLQTLPPVFAIGGLSLGGIVAMALALRAPERVAGLWIAAANAKAPTDAQRAGWRSWLERLDDGVRPADLQRDILGALLSPEARGHRPDLADRAVRMGGDTAPDRLRAQLRMQATRVDLRAGLRRVTAPSLVIDGAADALCPPAFLDEIAAALPRARRASVAAGHLIPLEEPQAFGGLVRRWWEQIGPATPQPRASRSPRR